MDKQIEIRRSHNISRCDVRVYGNGRSRAVAWVLVVSQVFVRALCSWLCVWQCCWLGQIFFWVEVILFCTCTRVQVRNTAAMCGFTFLLANSRKEPPLRTQVVDRRGHHPHISLHSCCDMYVHAYFWLRLLSVHVSHKQTHTLCVKNVIQQRVFCN